MRLNDYILGATGQPQCGFPICFGQVSKSVPIKVVLDILQASLQVFFKVVLHHGGGPNLVVASRHPAPVVIQFV